MEYNAGEVTHCLGEKRGVRNAIIHTQGTGIIKRTDEHLYAPEVQAVSCCETKICIKMRTRESQDTSHHIVGESLVIISEGTAAGASDLAHPTAPSSRVYPDPGCPGPVCSSNGAAPDARGHRASPVLRVDLHRTYSTRRQTPGAAVPYQPVNYHIQTRLRIPTPWRHGTTTLTPRLDATTLPYRSS